MTEQFKENKSMENASREEEHIFPEALSSKAEPSNTEAKPGQLLPGLVIFALAVIVGGGYLLLRPKNHGIDLNSYLKIQSIGSDGQGSLEAEIDWDALLEKEKENIRYSKEAEEGFLPLLYPDAVDYAKNIIMLPDFSQTTDLKNGDTVQYHWDFSEESASRLLTTADVSNFQAQYPNSMFPGERSITQMIINEMYARHGYIFKDQALTDYFAQKSWYTPRTADMEEIYPVMNDVEQANVTLLRTYS